MSFCDQTAAAIDGARTLTRLDHLSKAIWQALAAEAVGDDDAQSLAERLHARRSVLRGDLKPVGLPTGRASIFPPRRLQRAPVRSAAIARRRQLAASGPMPPALAAHFTTAELAVLRIVGDEMRGRGCCDRSIAELAARAGCGRTTVQNALREAARLGLVTVAERRRDGRKNDTNVIRVVSREWLAWLARGRSRPSSISIEPIGFKMANPTDRKFKSEPSKQRNRGRAAEGQGRVRTAHNRDS